MLGRRVGRAERAEFPTLDHVEVRLGHVLGQQALDLANGPHRIRAHRARQALRLFEERGSVDGEVDETDALGPERALAMDLRGYLCDDLLVKVDITSMAHGLEVRAPFLDHRLVDFVTRLPFALKLRRFETAEGRATICGDAIYDFHDQIIEPDRSFGPEEYQVTGNHAGSKRSEKGAVRKLMHSKARFLLPVHDKGAKIENGRVVGRVGLSIPGPVEQSVPRRNWFPM